LPDGQITELPRSASAENRSAEAGLVPLVYACPRHARVVELRFFAGYAERDVAGIPGVSPETVKRDRRFAKLRLSWKMGKHNDAD
jgi:hypothetical protein